MPLSAYFMKSRGVAVHIEPSFSMKNRELEAIKACDEDFKRIAEKSNQEPVESLIHLVDYIPPTNPNKPAKIEKEVHRY